MTGLSKQTEPRPWPGTALAATGLFQILWALGFLAEVQRIRPPTREKREPELCAQPRRLILFRTNEKCGRKLRVMKGTSQLGKRGRARRGCRGNPARLRDAPAPASCFQCVISFDSLISSKP
uniref:Uncharacterized protein n=1 Tax=Rousettus aegyptiacus TaxID=9407 RepID=A0A7J8BA96_ROUAE|nr:hypothetical protein HJG63_009942 [Rousettus aegyptiacus]